MHVILFCLEYNLLLFWSNFFLLQRHMDLYGSLSERIGVLCLENPHLFLTPLTDDIVG